MPGELTIEEPPPCMSFDGGPSTWCLPPVAMYESDVEGDRVSSAPEPYREASEKVSLDTVHGIRILTRFLSLALAQIMRLTREHHPPYLPGIETRKHLRRSTLREPLPHPSPLKQRMEMTLHHPRPHVELTTKCSLSRMKKSRATGTPRKK